MGEAVEVTEGGVGGWVRSEVHHDHAEDRDRAGRVDTMEPALKREPATRVSDMLIAGRPLTAPPLTGPRSIPVSVA